jgi:hypothetical protein
MKKDATRRPTLKLIAMADLQIISGLVRYLFYQIISVGSEQISSTWKAFFPPKIVYFLPS